MSEEKNIPNQESEDSPDSYRDKKTEVKKEMNEQLMAKQPETSNQQPAFAEASGDKQATANMETHAHHLHKVPGKKWTHYLFEFLMLFLAVFAGFLAENWREHIAEHQRAREYAKALIDDLKNDTLEILDVIKEDKIVLACFDSINSTIQKGIKNNNVPGSFYYYCNMATFSPTVVWNNATLTQITQSGSLRYFRNIELIKKLSSYYSRSEFVTNQNNSDKGYRDECIRLRGRILDNQAYSRYSAYLIGNWLDIPDSLLKARCSLQNTDVNLLNEFANGFEARRRALRVLMTRDYPQALQIAKELIELLQKEYHLE